MLAVGKPLVAAEFIQKLLQFDRPRPYNLRAASSERPSRSPISLKKRSPSYAR